MAEFEACHEEHCLECGRHIEDEEVGIICARIVQFFGLTILMPAGVIHYECATPEVQEQWRTQRAHMLARDKAELN